MKVSILIPFYNAEAFLRETIQSALQQTWAEKEIVLVDDGSSDRSLEIARSFESPTVKVFTQPNMGACRARNRAFSESTGEYIQYLDADDLLSPDKISNQMDLVSVSPLEVISCGWLRFYTNKELLNIVPRRFLDRDWPDPMDWLLNSWEGKGMGLNSIWLTPRILIEKAGLWNETLTINQDGEFFCRVLLASNGIRYSPSGVVYYRSGNSGSVSQKRNYKNAKNLLLSYKLNEEHILRKRNSERTRKCIAATYRSFIYIYYDSFPDLVQTAKEYLYNLGVNDTPLTGGRNFKVIAGFIGFQNALRLRSFYRRLQRIITPPQRNI